MCFSFASSRLLVTSTPFQICLAPQVVRWCSNVFSLDFGSLTSRDPAKTQGQELNPIYAEIGTTSRHAPIGGRDGAHAPT